MKKKVMKRVIIIIVIISAIALLYLWIGNFNVSAVQVAKITVQWQTQEITIDQKDKIQEFCKHINETNFKLKGYSTGKGWKYWVKCYDSTGNKTSSFVIVGDTVINHNLIYGTSKGKFNDNFIDKLFPKS